MICPNTKHGMYFKKLLLTICAGLIWFGGTVLITSTPLSAQEEVMSWGKVCAQKFKANYVENCGIAGIDCDKKVCTKYKRFDRECQVGFGYCTPKALPNVRDESYIATCVETGGGCNCQTTASGDPRAPIDWGPAVVNWHPGSDCDGIQAKDPPDDPCPFCP